ncbi:MAG: hypothetical protein VKK98_07530 [Cyanobacteriota bacterium]|nr:hypothetical protein [Cyanobacteriota bacterium]
MAQRHWLDPLARLVLQATGQIAPPTPDSAQRSTRSADTDGSGAEADDVELELLALRLRQNPGLKLRDASEVRRAAALGWRLDVNRASHADWQRLPGLGPQQADLLLRLQAGGVQLSGAEDLERVLELSAETVAAWLPLLEFRWYGTAPAAPAQPRLDVNRARPAELEALGLSQERCLRLQRERARAPFQDLADLQERLQFPPELVESWIGRVRFGSGPIGPVLPGTPGS